VKVTSKKYRGNGPGLWKKTTKVEGGSRRGRPSFREKDREREVNALLQQGGGS